MGVCCQRYNGKNFYYIIYIVDKNKGNNLNEVINDISDYNNDDFKRTKVK